MQNHTMDMLWEKFRWFLPLCMKPISFQSKAAVVCSVTTAVFIDFRVKKLNVFSQHSGQNKWMSEFRRTNHKDLKCQSSFCFNYFLRYYMMMQHQPIVKWMSTNNLLGHISSLSLLFVQTQTARWKAAAPEQLTDAHLYLDIAKSGYLFHGYSGGMYYGKGSRW